MGTFTSSWNTYNNTANSWDYTKAVFATAAGIVEVGVGTVTSEFGVGLYLMADGTSRAMVGAAKIYTLATSGRDLANSAPTNMGGVLGYLADYMINPNGANGQSGTWQSWLGNVNDAASLLIDGYNSNFNLPGSWLKSINERINSPAVIPITDAIDFYKDH